MVMKECAAGKEATGGQAEEDEDGTVEEGLEEGV